MASHGEPAVAAGSSSGVGVRGVIAKLGHADEGVRMRALSSRRFGPYSLQAAIAAVHADAKTAAETDWAEIVGLYDVLHRLEPSPVVELNRAVAVAMRDGADAGLRLVDAILARGELRDYHFAHAARAEFCRRLGRRAEARDVGGRKFLAQVLQGVSGRDLPTLIDAHKAQLGSGAILLIADADGKAAVAAGVTDDLTADLSAVDMVKAAVAELGGKGGGGRPDMAQGGGPDAGNAAAAIAAAEKVVGG